MPTGSFVLGLLPTAAIVVGSGLEILETNLAAERLLAKGDILGSKGGRLSPASAALQRALAQAVQQAVRSPFRAPEPFSLARSDLPPVSFAVVAVPHRGTGARVKRKVLVLFSDPADAAEVDETFLARMFEFTPAEAGIAAQVMRGKDVAAIAEASGLSRYTVRNHLKRLFAKTHTSGHCELLYTLLRCPAGLITVLQTDDDVRVSGYSSVEP